MNRHPSAPLNRRQRAKVVGLLYLAQGSAARTGSARRAGTAGGLELAQLPSKVAAENAAIGAKRMRGMADLLGSAI